MKKILLIFLLVPKLSMGQQNPTMPASKITTAGDELIKAKNHYLFGAALIGIGTLITVMPSADSDAEQNKQMRITGGLISVIGLVLTLESIGHIGKAGRKLNEKGIGLRICPASATLAYRF